MSWSNTRNYRKSYKHVGASGAMQLDTWTEVLYLGAMYSLLTMTTLTWVFFLEGTISRDCVPM